MSAPELVERIAVGLVAGGRIVPGLEIDAGTGRWRAVWWPMPAARDRAALLGLCGDGGVEAHLEAAAALGAAVDARARARLAAVDGIEVPRTRGRPGVALLWVRALLGDDPWLPETAPPEGIAELAATVAAWAAEGVPRLGSARLCLRLREPVAPADGPWTVELLLQDLDEPSLLVPAADVWAGVAPFGADAVTTFLAQLARAVRIAPELAGALDEVQPDAVAVDAAAVLTLARERAEALTDAGIGVLLPAWWGRRRRPALRAKARSARSGSAGGVAAIGLDALVDVEWQAVLGDRALTARDVAALEAAAAAKQSLVRVRGEWVEVRPGELDDLLARAGTRSTATAGDLLRAGLGLADGAAVGLPEGVEIDEVTATGWLGRLLDDAAHGEVAGVASPAGFEGTLRPYQERGVGWLAFLGRLGLGACLADDMGLGKTAQLIASLLADPVPGPTLVVCPVSVLGNWERELARFAPGLSVLVHHGAGRHGTRAEGPAEPFVERAAAHDVVLTAYSLLARDLPHLQEVAWARVVLDEAQQIKNPGTSQARAARAIAAPRRVALTGTPVENRLSELWSIMQFCNPGLLGSARSFREHFAQPIEQDGDDEAAARLRRVTAPFVLRRLKTDRTVITDLPDKIEVTERCVLTREQATLYQAVVDDLLTVAEEKEDEEGIARHGAVLAGLLRLKQVCNHPAHFLSDGSPLAGRSGKLTRIEQLLDEILDARPSDGLPDKVLCFTQFAEWGTLLQPHLAQRYGEEVLWLHGGVRRSLRDEQVAAFQSQDGPRILLVSLKAGGTGLNLTAASHVIHLDRWWNPAVEDQATDRAYRIGQQRTVVVHKPVCTGTVEERIDEMITAKRALAEKVVGTGEDMLSGLSTEELRAVVALGAGAVED